MLGRDAFGWYIQQLDQVLLRSVGNGQDVIGLTHGASNLAIVVTAAGARKKLWVVQKSEVIDGDDVSPRAAQGRNEIRAVQQVEAARQQFGAERQRLQPVVTGCVERGPGEASGAGCTHFATFEDGDVLRGIQRLQGVYDFTNPGCDSTLAVGEQARIKADTLHTCQYSHAGAGLSM